MLAYLLGALLLIIGIVFVSYAKSGIRQHGMPMSRQWPRISSVKASIQHFLRQAFRETKSGPWTS